MIAALKAYWATARVYAFTLGVILLAAAWWWHGRQQFAAGKAAGDAEVASLKTKYAAASAAANARAQEQQRQADAAAAAEALRRQQQTANQLAITAERAATAERRAKAFQDKYNDLKTREPAVRDWAATPIPASVRAAGTGGP